jgi:hypothetical protein
MKTLTRFINPVFEAPIDYAEYEVIENEIIKASDLEGLTISGSLFSLTTFTGVTFKSCVFFASRMENCIFVDCKFENCRFEFTHISHCSFENVEFKNCSWEFSSLNENKLNHSHIDVKTQLLLNKGSNIDTNCVCPITTDWEEAEQLQLKLQEEAQSVEEEETNQWGSTLLNFFKAA